MKTKLRSLTNDALLKLEFDTLSEISMLSMRLGTTDQKSAPNIYRQLLKDARTTKAKLTRIQTEMAFRQITPMPQGKKTKAQLHQLKGNQ